MIAINQNRFFERTVSDSSRNYGALPSPLAGSARSAAWPIWAEYQQGLFRKWRAAGEHRHDANTRDE